MAAAAALLGTGCDLVPGTGAYEEKRARAAAAQLLIDPGSAQFRNVAGRDTAVCGEINGRNRMGAYVGFTRFWVDTSTWKASLDPRFDYERLASAERLCASIGGASCSDEAEERMKRLDQAQFDSEWDNRCEGSAAAGGLAAAPWDPTGSNAASLEENWIEEKSSAGNEVSAPRESVEEPLMDEDSTLVDAMNGTDANLGIRVDRYEEELGNAAIDEG